MENFNKVLSFVLGLVVVIVFVIVLSGRLNLRGGILGDKSQKPKVTVTLSPTPTQGEKKGFFSRIFSKKATPTPTVSKVSPTPIVIGQNGQPVPTTQPANQTKGGTTQVDNVNEIPSTGLPSVMLPLFGSSALLGIYLRKKK